MVIYERNPFFGSDIQFKESEYFLEPNLVIRPDSQPDSDSVPFQDRVPGFTVDTGYTYCPIRQDLYDVLGDWISDFCTRAFQCLQGHWPLWLLMLVGLSLVLRQKKRDRRSSAIRGLSNELETETRPGETEELVHVNVDGANGEKSKDKSQDVEKLVNENKQVGLVIV